LIIQKVLAPAEKVNKTKIILGVPKDERIIYG
jgi:hypothetical protein